MWGDFVWGDFVLGKLWAIIVRLGQKIMGNQVTQSIIDYLIFQFMWMLQMNVMYSVFNCRARPKDHGKSK